MKERQSFGDNKVYPIYDRLCKITALELKDQNALYHKSCYAEYSGLSRQNRAQAAYGRAMAIGF